MYPSDLPQISDTFTDHSYAADTKKHTHGHSKAPRINAHIEQTTNAQKKRLVFNIHNMVKYGVLKIIFNIFKDHAVIFSRPSHADIHDSDEVKLIDLFMEGDVIHVFIDFE